MSQRRFKKLHRLTPLMETPPHGTDSGLVNKVFEKIIEDFNLE